jgi:NADPH:quinone reductase
MKAVAYARLGEPSVLELVERPIPEPGEHEVTIRVLVSGVNPTDWKSRSGAYGGVRHPRLYGPTGSPKLARP